jgi:alpha-D-ribose 1-methylphosphonate 5-triphosphate synthase subunit PhnH
MAFTLLDNEVSFHVCGNEFLADEIKSYTLAEEEKIESADFIFVCSPDEIGNAIEFAKCGTLPDPHKSATIIIVNEDEQICPISLSGLGISGSTEILVSKTMIKAIAQRDAQNYEYPQGIDFLFISKSEGGKLMAIPRLIRMEMA